MIASLLPGTVPISAGSPPLRRHVGHVLSVGAQEEMGRINAGWRIAAVEDVAANWDRAYREFPSEPMRPYETPGAIGVEGPIAIRPLAGNPQPAVTGRIHLLPEPLDSGPLRERCAVAASLATEPRGLGPERVDEEGRSALLTEQANAAEGRATIGVHLGAPSRGAEPPDVSASRGYFYALNYTSYQIEGGA